MNYQDLIYFIHVAGSGSIARASRVLNIPTSTLSRRLQALEQQLGYRLLHRSAQKFGMTEAGERFYQNLSPLIHDLEQRFEDTNSQLSSLSGDIRITAPVALGHYLIRDWVFEFMEVNPRISIELLLSNNNVDLVRNSIDIAFRIGQVSLNDWVCRHLFESGLTLCASPEQEQKIAELQHPEELQQQALIVMKRNTIWRFMSDQQQETLSMTPSAQLRTDDIQLALAAVRRGIGIACLPHYVVRPELEHGRLIRVLPEWHMPARPVQMLYPHRESLPLKTRTFIDFIMIKISAMP